MFKALELRQDTFQQTPLEHIGHALATSKLNIAWAYLKDDQLNTALNYYDQSLKELKPLKSYNPALINRDIIVALQNTAKIKCLNGQYEAAYDRINEVLLYQVKDNAFKKPYSYELLGDINLAEGKYEEAILHFQKALSITKKYYAKSNLPDYARKLYRLATVYKEMQRLDEAFIYYQKALQVLAPKFTSDDLSKNPVSSNIYSKIDALDIISGKGEALFEEYHKSKDKNSLIQAYDAYNTGIHIITALRQGGVSAEAKNILAEKTVSIYEGAIRSALEQYKVNKDENMLLRAFTLAESNKSLLLLESINEQAALGIKGLPDSLLQKDKALRLEIAYYQKELIEAQNKPVKNDSQIKV